MDVLFESDELKEDLKQYIVRTFNPKELVKNGAVNSFEYKEFQIDLICVPRKNFQTSVDYFAWNDLGNLMGRVSHKLGFKLGHEGLSMTFRDGDYQYAEVSVSRDARQIFAFLDYDYERFLDGFDTVEEIFNFASSSKYFNKEIYSLDNRNHASRVRDRKRKTYNEFLTWVEVTEGLPAYPWAQMKEQGGRQYKDEFLRLAFDHFPGFKEQHDKVQHNFNVWKQVKAAFNGSLVREWTGLQDRELGEFMKHLRTTAAPQESNEWNAFVLANGVDGMKTWTMEVFNSYQTGN
jgi:hypothetical protein